MRKIILFAFILFFGFGFSKLALAKNEIKNETPILFQKARLLAVAEFNLQTGDKFKVFKCTLFDETNEDWLFVFDEFTTPPPPGGGIVFIYINKKTGKAIANWGK